MRNYGYMEKGQSGSLGDLTLWIRIFRNSCGYVPAIFVAVVLSLVVTGATLGLPYLMKTAIDQYITVPDLPGSDRIGGLTSVGLKFGTLIVIVFAVTFIQVVLLEWVGQSVMLPIFSN